MEQATVHVSSLQWSEWRAAAQNAERRQRLLGALAAVVVCLVIVAVSLAALGPKAALSAIIYGPLVGWDGRGAIMHFARGRAFERVAAQMRELIVPAVLPRLSAHGAFQLAFHDGMVFGGTTAVRARTTGTDITITADQLEIPRMSIWQSYSVWSAGGATPGA